VRRKRRGGCRLLLTTLALSRVRARSLSVSFAISLSLTRSLSLSRSLSCVGLKAALLPSGLLEDPGMDETLGAMACMVRKEAWLFYRTISGVRLCW